MPRRTIAFTTVALLATPACTESEADRNCSDFTCQSDAQAWHDSHPEDGLDGDGDGIACESLPNCAHLVMVSGLYRALLLDVEGALEFHLEVAVDGRDDHASSIRGELSWGPGTEACALIRHGSITRGVAWLAAQREDGASVAILIDLRTRAGTFLCDTELSEKIPAAAEFAITVTP